MGEIRYSISDAAKKVEVEAHVLRYWEDELGLEIPRNELGHRVYNAQQMDIFFNIKELKARGYQLKAIKELLPRIAEMTPEEIEQFPYLPEGFEEELLPSVKADKLEQFQELMTEIVADAMRQNSDQISSQVSDRVAAQLDTLLHLLQDQEEARFRELDESIRGHQQSHMEAAAAKAPIFHHEEPISLKKKRRLFQKRKRES